MISPESSGHHDFGEQSSEVGLLFAAQAASTLASFMDKIHPHAPALPQHAAQWQTCTTASCKLSSAN